MKGKARRWRPIVGYEGYYEVSDDGQVRSLWKRVGPSAHLTKQPVRVLNPGLSAGYVTVSLHRDGKRATKRIHVLVLEAFRGPRPDGFDASHLNGDRSDNRIENLIWESRRANLQRQRGHGTAPIGAQAPTAKLDEPAVQQIRRRLLRGESHSSVAKRFGVSRPHISGIASNRYWKSLPWPEPEARKEASS